MLGLAGRAGAGKSTLARLLAERHGYTIVPFAGPLKAMLAALGVPERHLWGSPAEKAAPLEILAGRSAREAMQTLGTEWGRACIGPEFWVAAWRAAADRAASPVVADDVRFDNEGAAIRALGGRVVRLSRAGGGLATVPVTVPAHASESGVRADVALLNWSGRADDMLTSLADVLARA